MELDRKDIEVIANSRIRRAEGNRFMVWTIGGLIAVVAGFYVIRISGIVGWIMIVGGFFAAWRYLNGLSKRQNIYKSRLLSEWKQERLAKQPPEVKK